MQCDNLLTIDFIKINPLDCFNLLQEKKTPRRHRPHCIIYKITLMTL